MIAAFLAQTAKLLISAAKSIHMLRECLLLANSWHPINSDSKMLYNPSKTSSFSGHTHYQDSNSSWPMECLDLAWNSMQMPKLLLDTPMHLHTQATLSGRIIHKKKMKKMRRTLLKMKTALTLEMKKQDNNDNLTILNLTWISWNLLWTNLRTSSPNYSRSILLRMILSNIRSRWVIQLINSYTSQLKILFVGSNLW